MCIALKILDGITKEASSILSKQKALLHARPTVPLFLWKIDSRLQYRGELPGEEVLS